jgi:hypothetical protein
MYCCTIRDIMMKQKISFTAGSWKKGPVISFTAGSWKKGLVVAASSVGGAVVGS